MKQLFSRFLLSIGFPLLGKEASISLIKKYLRYSQADIFKVCHDVQGIMKYHNMEDSGESFFLTQVLPSLFAKHGNEMPVIFDVGANAGSYSLYLKRIFPTAQLHAFEPNPSSFSKLEIALKPEQNVIINNFGLGSHAVASRLYTYGSDAGSEHATVFKDVLVDLHQSDYVEEIDITMNTLDQYCASKCINSIDFLKIDTEGNELEVLKGGEGLLAAGAIKIIQFEFNEMNVISRVFLKDFYDLLPGYRFYRIDTDRLIPLRSYSAVNEIFQFQNIVALHPAVSYV